MLKAEKSLVLKKLLKSDLMMFLVEPLAEQEAHLQIETKAKMTW